MEFKRSEKLEKLLDCEIARFEREEYEDEKEKRGKSELRKSEDLECENIIAEEITELESRFDDLGEEDKEYLKWLKN